MEFVFVGIVGLAAAALAWMIARRDVVSLQSRLDRTGETLRAETERRATAEARLEEQKRAAEEKIALLTEAQQKLSDAFKALSSEALNSNNQAFLDLAQATLARFQEGAKVDLEGKHKAIDESLKPLRDSLEKVDGKIQQL